MKQSKRLFRSAWCRKHWLAVILVCLLPTALWAQDNLPSQAVPDRHSVPIYPSREIRELMRFVAVSNPMPETFRDTLDNVITDPVGSLYPFWQKMSRMDRPLRIVHIGDSHVRGHLFPYVMRRCLEDDFGKDAVEDIPVDYRTSGLARETGKNGIVYHMLGVNGATCASFATPERLDEVIALHPDLIILSFGTNEAHGWRYVASEHEAALDRVITQLKESCPGEHFLLTTPPGAYVRNGRRGKRIPNPRTEKVVDTELRYAREHGLAIWDLYDTVGGKQQACRNWDNAGMFQRDKIHFTREGYILQGLLLHEAFIKAYNQYVATGLE